MVRCFWVDAAVYLAYRRYWHARQTAIAAEHVKNRSPADMPVSPPVRPDQWTPTEHPTPRLSSMLMYLCERRPAVFSASPTHPTHVDYLSLSVSVSSIGPSPRCTLPLTCPSVRPYTLLNAKQPHNTTKPSQEPDVHRLCGRGRRVRLANGLRQVLLWL